MFRFSVWLACSGSVTLTLAPWENETGACSLDFPVKVKTTRPLAPDAEFEKAYKQKDFLETLDRLAAAVGAKISARNSVLGVFEFSDPMKNIDCVELQACVTSGYICVKKSISPNGSGYAIYPTRDKYSVLRVEGTNGDNYNISSKKLITWLKKLELTHPFTLTCCNNASMGGRFLAPVQDADKLAAQFLKICPDILEVQSFKAELEETQGFLLWWD